MRKNETKLFLFMILSILCTVTGLVGAVLLIIGLYSTRDLNGINDRRDYLYKNEVINASADVLINEKSARIFEEALSKVNPDIVSEYLSWGGSFCFDDIEKMNEDTGKTSEQASSDSKLKENNDDYSDYSVFGYYKPAEVSIHLTWRYTAIEEVLFHELGHFIDHSLGTKLDDVYYVSQLDSWNDVYTNESGTSDMDRYHTDDKKEFFAQSFSLYMTDPQNLQAKCPEVFSYIKNIDEHYGLFMK